MVYQGRIPISTTQQIPRKVTNSLNQTLFECFNSTIEQLSFPLPSLIYISTTDSNLTNVIATASFTSNQSLIPYQYRSPTSLLLYNVCTRKMHQGRGYMKKLLISSLEDLYYDFRQPIRVYLEVDPSNVSAKQLYYKLGFQTIDTTHSGRYELMYLYYS